MFSHSPSTRRRRPARVTISIPHPTLQKRQTLFVLSTWVLRPCKRSYGRRGHLWADLETGAAGDAG